MCYAPRVIVFCENDKSLPEEHTMQKKLVITIDEKIYEGMRRKIGRRRPMKRLNNDKARDLTWEGM